MVTIITNFKYSKILSSFLKRSFFLNYNEEGGQNNTMDFFLLSVAIESFNQISSAYRK